MTTHPNDSTPSGDAAPQNDNWRSLGLHEDILKLVDKAGFVRPTPIQAQAIPVAMRGDDLIASAKTGSGKTACFCLPMIHYLKERRGTYGLILCPTREIANQTQETLELFGTPLGVRSIVLIGGTDVKADEAAIRTHPQIIVGTPGRICDHLERGNLWLEYIETLVLDEADRMLDMGFAKELNRIVGEIPADKRQTLLFSATMPPAIEQLARKILRRPVRVGIGESLSVNKNVDHEILWVNENRKRIQLIRIIERNPSASMIVFVRTKDDASRLWRSIHAAGIHESTYISSNKAQKYREEALQGFKDGKYRVMVATDVAGRGIHVEGVGYVINYDVPREPEDYIHRVGRTGRQDARGRAITFATPSDRRLVRDIERVLGEPIPSRESRDFKGGSDRGERGASSRGGSGRPGRSIGTRERRPGSRPERRSESQHERPERRSEARHERSEPRREAHAPQQLERDHRRKETRPRADEGYRDRSADRRDRDGSPSARREEDRHRDERPRARTESGSSRHHRPESHAFPRHYADRTYRDEIHSYGEHDPGARDYFADREEREAGRHSERGAHGHHDRSDAPAERRPRRRGRRGGRGRRR